LNQKQQRSFLALKNQLIRLYSELMIPKAVVDEIGTKPGKENDQVQALLKKRTILTLKNGRLRPENRLKIQCLLLNIHILAWPDPFAVSLQYVSATSHHSRPIILTTGYPLF